MLFKKFLFLGSSAFVLGFTTPTFAADIVISNGQTVGQQQLVNSNDTIIIQEGGTISTGGIYESAIFIPVAGNNSTITNNGTLTISGYGAFGIDNLSLNSTFINNSIITTTGFRGYGIYTTAISTITNNGTIAVSGDSSYGICLENTDLGTHITNNGTVTASGINSYGIYAGGSNSVITNNGTVDTILINGPDATVILGAHSNITGNIIYNSTGGILQYSTGMSYATEGGGFATGSSAPPTLPSIIGTYTLNVINNGNGNLLEGAVLVTSGSQTLAVTPDTFSGTDLMITNMASQVGSLINQRQQYALLGGNLGVADGTQYAANTSSMSDVEPAAGGFLSEQSIGWAEGFGAYRERPTDGDTAFSRTRSGGILTGLDLPLSSDGYRSGLYVGGFGGEQILGKTKFRTIESVGALAGGYIGKKFDDMYLSVDVSGGYAYHDSDRNVGADVAKADYGSYFISPALTIMSPIAHNNVTWVPSLTLRYTGQYTEDYQESGSAADQDVDARTAHSLSTRAQVEAHMAPKTFNTGTLTPVARLGIEGETYIGNRDVDLTVLGSNVTLNPSGGDNTVSGIVGLNVSYDLRDGPEVYLDGESALGLNKGGLKDNIGGTLRIGARWEF